jgi:hypothetical protein
MSRVDKCTLTVVLIIIAVIFPFRLWWDLHHPEKWSPGSLNDPHIYLWGWALLGMVIAYVTARIVTCECKTRARKVKLATLYVRVEKLIREKRWQEAEGVLQECEQLANETYI